MKTTETLFQAACLASASVVAAATIASRTLSNLEPQNARECKLKSYTDDVNAGWYISVVVMLYSFASYATFIVVKKISQRQVADQHED